LTPQIVSDWLEKLFLHDSETAIEKCFVFPAACDESLCTKFR